VAATDASEIQAFVNALATGDEAGIRAFLSDDYFGHAHAPGEPGQADRWVELWPGVRAAVSDLAITLESLDDDGDGDVRVRATLTGTHSAELWGSPASGRAVGGTFALRFRRVADGWVVNADDPPSAMIGLLRAMGVVPPADEMHLPPKHPIAPPDFLLKLAFTGQAADKPCAHLADASVFEPATDVCTECVAMDSYWPALRMCLTCGNVGCCDTSLNKHARAHHEATGHPMMRSVRLAEGWMWCYVDGALFERRTLDRLAAEARGRTA
jgi:hypothetical protein